MPTLNELRQMKSAKVDTARDILSEAGEQLTQEQRDSYDALIAEIDGLSEDIKRMERQERLDSQQHSSAGRQAPDGPSEPQVIGMASEDIQDYSFVKAIRACMPGGSWRDAPLEYEVNQEMIKLVGEEPRSFYVPFDVVRGVNPAQRQVYIPGVGWQYRAVDTTAGASTIQTSVIASEFIDLLRNRMVVQQAGARVLNNLSGNVDIPRQSQAAVFEWKAEDGETTETDQDFDAVELRPKTGSAASYITRRLLLQSSLDIEQLVRDDLATVVALGFDYGALYGSGTGNEPEGVANVSGIGVPTAASPDWAGVVEYETLVASANADMGRLGYITSARVRGYWKVTEKATNTAQFIWSSGNTPVNEYAAHISNQVPDNLGVGTDESGIFFGNWGDLIIGFWSGIDMLVDPYTYSKKGGVLLVAHMDGDMAVRHPESFSYKSYAV